jgi:hypothetical protein
MNLMSFIGDEQDPVCECIQNDKACATQILLFVCVSEKIVENTEHPRPKVRKIFKMS